MNIIIGFAAYLCLSSWFALSVFGTGNYVKTSRVSLMIGLALIGYLLV